MVTTGSVVAPTVPLSTDNVGMTCNLKQYNKICIPLMAAGIPKKPYNRTIKHDQIYLNTLPMHMADTSISFGYKWSSKQYETLWYGVWKTNVINSVLNVMSQFNPVSFELIVGIFETGDPDLDATAWTEENKVTTSIIYVRLNKV